MKKIILLGFTLAFSSASGFCADRQIAFERDQAVWIAKLDGTGEKKIADGIFPAISPDGTRVAFNTIDKTDIANYVRQIAVVEVGSGKITVFRDIPSDKCYEASWSADGKCILFSLQQNEFWGLGLINADGTDFRVLKKPMQGEVTCYSPIFARDGRSVFCHNMRNIYRFGLDGAVLAQWEIEKIVPNADMSGDSRIDVSPDNKRLLLTVDMAEMPSGNSVWVGPVNALWSFDLERQHAVRITPKKLLGLDGVWIDNDNILFLGSGIGEQDEWICRMSVDGKNSKRLIRIKNARFPSVSAPNA